MDKLKIIKNLILVNKKAQLPHLEINNLNLYFKNRIKTEESVPS